MRLKNWMVGKAIVCAFFALIFELDPRGAADMYGMQVNDAGIYLSRLLGAAFVLGGSTLELSLVMSLGIGHCLLPSRE